MLSNLKWAASLPAGYQKRLAGLPTATLKQHCYVEECEISTLRFRDTRFFALSLVNECYEIPLSWYLYKVIVIVALFGLIMAGNTVGKGTNGLPAENIYI